MDDDDKHVLSILYVILHIEVHGIIEHLVRIFNDLKAGKNLDLCCFCGKLLKAMEILQWYFLQPDPLQYHYQIL